MSLEYTHRRRNPLTGQWVLVSPHRNNRPWLGATEAPALTEHKSYDHDCPLCPKNSRANDTYNPDYADTFVFKNDFGALTEQETTSAETNSPLFTSEVSKGECRVVCYSPDHSKTLPELTEREILKVIETWQQNYRELSNTYNNVHIFENKGEIMGCSQPHPHGQIWAHDHMSTEIAKEDSHQKAYYDAHKSNLLADYCEREISDNSRVICQNDHWLVVIPYWAAWPFETLVIARDDVKNFNDINTMQAQSLAEVLKELTTRYDNIFNCSFPYSMGWHCAPANQDDDSHWRLHAHFYPPLLRSASVKKHMVGYEMLAESQRDLTAEKAAEILKSTSTKHYKQER